MSGFIKSFNAEIRDQVLSSKRKLIKVIAICFVPFLYAFVCIWAFWDPIPKIGNAPIGIINNDKSQLVVTNLAGGNKLFFGAAKFYGSSKDDITNPINNPDDDWLKIDENDYLLLTSGKIVQKKDVTFHQSINVMKDVVSDWKSGKNEKIKYNAKKDKFDIKINDNTELTNVQYLDNTNQNDAERIASQDQNGNWIVHDPDKYWVQLQIPSDLTENMVGFFDALIAKIEGDKNVQNPQYFIDQLKNHPSGFWSTYKHNFIFGQFMYIFDKFKSGVLVDNLDYIISDVLNKIIHKGFDDIKNQMLFTAPTDLLVDELTFKDYINDNSVLRNEKIENMYFEKNQKYVLRNDEFQKALNKYVQDTDKLSNTEKSEWTASISKLSKTFDGETSIIGWQGGFANILTGNVNNLFKNDLIANFITQQLNKKINAILNSKTSGAVNINFDKQTLQNTLTNPSIISALLVQDASLINNDINTHFKCSNELYCKIIFGPDVNTNDISAKTLFATILGQNPNSFIKDNMLAKSKLVSLLSEDNTLVNNVPKNVYAILYDSSDSSQPTFIKNFNHDLNVLLKTNNTIDINNELSTLNLNYDANSLINMPHINDYIKTNIEGSQFNKYGIGLGQFFLCIGLWVGSLMQTFIYDRAKRYKKASTLAWYLSKSALMLLTGFVQCTVLMLSVCALGWYQIGPAFALEFLWMLITTFTFIIIVQALWYSLRNETLGKFLCVIMLIISLSSGWGTFPTFMQNPFFEVLSYITPYTYSIHGQGAIIYSVSINGANMQDSLYILQQFAILLLWMAIFLPFGIWRAYLRNREMYYGTSNAKKLGVILKEKKLTDYVNERGYASWKKLPAHELSEVKEIALERHKEESEFKWYIKWKENNPQAASDEENPLVASQTDDEIRKRNND